VHADQASKAVAFVNGRNEVFGGARALRVEKAAYEQRFNVGQEWIMKN